MGSWVQDFEDGQTRAVCSKCGVPYRYPRELKRQDDGFFYCPRCLEQTVKTRDRIQAESRRRREQPPPKFVQPPSYAEDYWEAEDAVARTLVREIPLSTDPTVIGWGVRYLADMVIENKRSLGWIARAKSVITTGLNSLLTLQYGYVGGPDPSVTSEKVRYGGFADGTTLYTSIAIIAGSAFVKGYTVLGTVAYLDAADRCAHFVRHMQCQDLDNNGQASQYGGGNYHIGGLAEGVSTPGGGITWVSRYNVFDIAAVWFLDLLRDIRGGSTQYGGVAGTDFTASTAATLDVMIAELVAFAVTGAKDSLFGGQYKSGLSVDYPRATYVASDASAASLSSWVLAPASAGSPAGVIRAQEIALALFALDAAGEASTLVSAVFDWLMTFTANPTNAAPAEDAELLIGTLVGTYDPTIALATELDVLDDDGTTVLARDHAGAGYDWLAAGLLAPIASVRQPVGFAAAKRKLGEPQPSQRGPNPLPRYIGETGYSGFTYQWSEPLQ